MQKKRVSLIWRILIVFLAIVIIWRGVHEINNWVSPGEAYDRTAHIVSAVLTPFLVLPIIFAARKYLDQRSWAGLRLTSIKEGWKSFVIGGLAYFLPAASALIVAIAFGWTEVSIETSFSEAFLQVLLIAALVFIFEALPEELVFRGYFYRNLNTSLSKLSAVFAQSILFVLFGIMVGAAGDIERITMFFGMSLVIGLIRVTTRNVWSAVGFHLVFQTMQQLFVNTHNDAFLSSTPGLMSNVILGIIPFSLAFLVLGLLVKEEPDWQEINPE